jgi:deoxycytidylate deaminase
MFLAFSAALRSADLSRQVGAVVAVNQQIVGTGANDSPKAGGGLYWPEHDPEGGFVDHPNGRDYKRGGDSNREEQVRIIDEIVSRAGKYGLDTDSLKNLLEDSRIRDLTEFGRVVHAEMEALLSCGRQGISTVGAEIFCTTFPCHNCAKHIIAAGIKRVVFIEPYAKSKALEFHDDAITTSYVDMASSGDRVSFEAFSGIGPRRFYDLFSMHLSSGYDLVRKDSATGKTVDWDIKDAPLRLTMKTTSYIELEMQASNQFNDMLSTLEPTGGNP